MTQNDFKNWMRIIQWVDPDAHAAAVDMADVDTPIDTLGFRYAVIIVNIGDSAGTWPIQVEASATAAGTYADITGALFSVGLTSDDTRLVGVLDLHGAAMAESASRFLQLAGVSVTAAIDLGVTIILMNPRDSSEYIDYSSGGADELTFDL